MILAVALALTLTLPVTLLFFGEYLVSGLTLFEFLLLCYLVSFSAIGAVWTGNFLMPESRGRFLLTVSVAWFSVVVLFSTLSIFSQGSDAELFLASEPGIYVYWPLLVISALNSGVAAFSYRGVVSATSRRRDIGISLTLILVPAALILIFFAVVVPFIQGLA